MKYVKIAMAVLIIAAIVLSVYLLATNKDKIYEFFYADESSSAAFGGSGDGKAPQSPDKAPQSSDKTSQTDKETEGSAVQGITKFPYYLNSDLKITNVLLYDGAYVEDSTFKPCQDIFAIRVENVSADDLLGTHPDPRKKLKKARP